MAVMLSAESYLDAFYYQNSRLLVEPGDYVPPINEENYFVQRGHGLLAALDAAAFQLAQQGRMTSPWYDADSGAVRRRLDQDFRRSGGEMTAAYKAVTEWEFQSASRRLRTCGRVSSKG